MSTPQLYPRAFTQTQVKERLEDIAQRATNFYYEERTIGRATPIEIMRSLINEAARFGCWICSEAVKIEEREQIWPSPLHVRLSVQLQDEEKAYRDYMDLAKQADREGQKSIAAILEGIALTEREHAKQLRGLRL